MPDWYANIDKARDRLGWEPADRLRARASSGPPTGTERSPTRRRTTSRRKKFGLDTVYSVSAIVACYKDNQAIPIMYERLKDDVHQAEHRFRDHLRQRLQPRRHRGSDPRHLAERPAGHRHLATRGTSARRRPSGSGMEIASKNACVLLDGDLQDPPELIEQFVAHWREGYDVVYGRRVKREATLLHAVRLQGVLPGLRLLLLHPDPPRRRRFLADGQAGRPGDPAVPRARPVPARASGPSPGSSRPASTTSGPSGCLA